MLKQAEARYPTHSLVASEIAQQPLLWPTTLERVLAVSDSLSFADLPVIFTGAGTSAYAASAAAAGWPGAQGIATTDLMTQSASEIISAVPAFSKGGWLISLARSGDSPESVGVVQRIQRLFPQVKHLAIVCNEHGRLTHTPGVEAICLDPRTNDRSLAMTASFSNLVLAGLCLHHSAQLLNLLPAVSATVTGQLLDWHHAAAEVAAACGDRLVFLSSGMFALTQESSIKVVEMTAGHVMPLPETFLGLRHGPLSFARPDTPIVCFASSDTHKRAYEKDLLADLRAKGLGKLVLIGDDSVKDWEHDVFVPAAAPGLPTHLRTPFEVVFSQLLAYHLSLAVGMDPDNPSPDGVVTRVVRPFQVHEDSGT